MLIFPAIDLRGGKCVRLLRGDYAQETIYGEDPAAVAREFEAAGANFLHVVDLDGARAGTPLNLEVIGRIRTAVSIPMQVGGGVRSEESISQLLGLGVDRVILGSRLVADLEWAAAVLGAFGERLVVGIDARDGRVAVSGWEQTSDQEAVELANRLAHMGATRVIFTDIGRDGTLEGPNLASLQRMIDGAGMPVIASGGVGSLQDLRALRQRRIEGVIVGKALYEGRFTLDEALRAGA